MADVNFRFVLPDEIISNVMRYFDSDSDFLESKSAVNSLILKGDDRLARNSCAVSIAYYDMLQNAVEKNEGEVSINNYPLLSIVENDIVPFRHRGMLVGRNEWTGSLDYALDIMPVVFMFDVNFSLLDETNNISKFVFELIGLARKRDWRGRKTIVTTRSVSGLTERHVAGLSEFFKFVNLESVL